MVGESSYCDVDGDHIGERPDNLHAMSKNKVFVNSLGLTEDINNYFEHDPHHPPYSMCFMCKDVHHSSVSAARLWAELLHRWEFAVEGPNDLSQSNWWGCKGAGCSHCDPDAYGKKEQFDKFVNKLGDIWK